MRGIHTLLNENISGTKPRARRKELMDNLDQYFSNPIIHREIHGDKVYVPLDLKRIWNRIS
jgi:hypothetical protein